MKQGLNIQNLNLIQLKNLSLILKCSPNNIKEIIAKGFIFLFSENESWVFRKNQTDTIHDSFRDWYKHVKF